MICEQFEPVYLVPEGPARLTEYGKSWLDKRVETVEKHWASLKDICKLAALEATRWADIQRALDESGVPQNITSGISQYAMAKVIDHLNTKTTFTVPAACAMALGTTPAPTSTTTGATLTEAAYTGYARQAIVGGGWVAATAATPSVGVNNGAITFGACTAGTSTLIGFMLADSATLAAGNSLWYGTLTSTVISTTQTPPTVASGALSVSLNGT